MKPLRPANGEARLNDDSYCRCTFGLHLSTSGDKPYATHRIEMYHNPLGASKVMYTCGECAEKRLTRLREEFQNVVVEEVGRVRK